MAKSISSFNFLKEALILPTKNPKLFYRIFFIFFISNLSFYLINYFSTQFFLTDIAAKSKALATTDPSSPEFLDLVSSIKRDTKEISILKLIISLVLFILNLFLVIITYFATSVTYEGKILTLKEVISKAKVAIKGPLITQACVTLVTFGYILSVSIVAVVCIVVISGRSMALAVLVTLFVLISLIFIYFSVALSMSVVVSVVETGCYGFGAIRRAVELLKGKKKQVFVFLLLLVLLSGVNYVLNILAIKYLPSSIACKLGLGLISVFLWLGVNLYTMAAVTALYYECTQSYENIVAGKLAGDQFLYSKLPVVSANVDIDVP